MRAMIEKCVDCLAGLDALTVKVGEHLLASRGIGVHEEHDSDGFIGQGGVVVHRFKDGLPAMLAVIDDELGAEWDLKLADVGTLLDRNEGDILVDGCRERGEDVAVSIGEDIVLDLGDTLGVQVALDAVEGLHLAVVEDGHAFHHSE